MYSSFEDQPFIQFAQAAVTPPDGVREEWLFWSDLADGARHPTVRLFDGIDDTSGAMETDSSMEADD